MQNLVRRPGQQGQAVTEFVIWMFTLMLMMSGIMHFGRAYFLQQQCVLSSRYMAYKSARFSENQLSYAQVETRGKYFYSFPGTEDGGVTMSHEAPSAGGLGGVGGMILGSMSLVSDTVRWQTNAHYTDGPLPNGFLGVTLQPTLHGMSSAPGGTWNNRNLPTGGDTIIAAYSVVIGGMWARHYF